MKWIERISLALPVLMLLAIGAALAVAGWPRLSLQYLVDAPSDLGDGGGVGPLLANTAVIVLGALALATPCSLATALACSMGGSQTARLRNGCRRVLEVAVCVPRLLWGLAGAALFCHVWGMGLSAAAGILTLAVVLCPILVTGFMDGFDASNRRYGPTCRALGMGERMLWFRIVLPGSRQSLIAACMLAAGRACGDAAALLLTAGIGQRFIGHPADPASTLAVHVYVLVEQGGGSASAMAAAFVMLLFTTAIQGPLAWMQARRLVPRR